KNTVTLEFLGFLNAEEFKQVWLGAMLLIEEKKAAYFYINASQERIIPPGTEEWLVQDFFAIAEKAAQSLGYRLRVARAESEDIFNKLASERSVNHFIKQIRNFDFENFPSVEKALAWLYAK
ncbi:MAG: hypothetical protein SFU27_13860, partial [Thermonemataceae bacterium]|nr:hypothetical protein [Thermonemataceae bacterium]